MGGGGWRCLLVLNAGGGTLRTNREDQGQGEESVFLNVCRRERKGPDAGGWSGFERKRRFEGKAKSQWQELVRGESFLHSRSFNRGTVRSFPSLQGLPAAV